MTSKLSTLASAVPTSSQQSQGGERGVSTVLGALLMFGILMAVVVSIQATAVPIWDQGIEFQHDARVEEDLAETRDDILRSAAEGQAYSGAVELGVNYPTRPFLFSPADPSGTIRTSAPGPVTVAGAVAQGEAGKYWDGSPVSYTTRSLVYEAAYNELQDPPQYIIEHTAFAERHEEATLQVGAPTLVTDRRINLVLLEGSVAQSGTGATSITVRPISAPATTTAVRGETGPITVTVPTQLDEAYWQTALTDELASNGGHITSISVESGGQYDLLRLELEQGVTYKLRTAKIEIGSGGEPAPPHYLTTGSEPGRTTVGETREYTFVVKDRYNNPVEGVDLNVSVASGPGEVLATSNPSDAAGVVTVDYRSNAAGTAELRATFGTTPDALRTASHTIEVTETAGSGATPAIDQGLDSNVVVTDVTTSLLFDANEVGVTFSNRGDTKAIDSVRFISFYDGVILCPCPDGVSFGSSTPTASRNEPVTDITPNVSLPNGDTTVKLAFTDASGLPAAVGGQDWVLLELVFDDGTRSTYMIQLDTEDAV